MTKNQGFKTKSENPNKKIPKTKKKPGKISETGKM